MKNNFGFTLIELVTVIVILGTLSLVVVPKFIDISSDGHRAKMKLLEGSLKEAVKLVYAKSLIEGEENISQQSATAPGVDGILTHYGYPIFSEIKDLLNLSENDWTIVVYSIDLFILPGHIVEDNSQSFYNAIGSGADACNITYTQSAVRRTPRSITSHLDGC
jgi:MSHA pilin protein MshA